MKVKRYTFVSCLLIGLGLILYVLQSSDRGKASAFPEEAPKQASQPSEPLPEPATGVLNIGAVPAAGSAKQEVDVPLGGKAGGPVESRNEKGVLRAASGGYLSSRVAPLPRGTATLTFEDRKISPSNFSGHYQRVLMDAEASAKVVLHWPGVGPERSVFLHAIHGGRINGASGTTLKTNSLGQVVFEFETTSNPGRYEILVRSGPSEVVLHFWVPVGEPGVDLSGL